MQVSAEIRPKLADQKLMYKFIGVRISPRSIRILNLAQSHVVILNFEDFTNKKSNKQEILRFAQN
jgi:hypothetical protein